MALITDGVIGDGSGGGSGAPTDAKYLVAEANGSLSAEVNLGALTTGLLKHTVAGAVSTPATAVANTDYLPVADPVATGTLKVQGAGAAGVVNATSGSPSHDIQDGGSSRLKSGFAASSSGDVGWVAGGNRTFGFSNESSGRMFHVGIPGSDDSGPFAGGTTTVAKAGGVLKTVQADTGNVGAGEDDLHSYSLPAGILANNGESVEIEAIFTFAANGTGKQIKLYFGATAIFDTTSVAQNGGSCVIRARVVRTGATAQRAMAWLVGGSGLTDDSSYSTPAETLSGAITIKSTGTAGADNDIVARITSIKWMPANN